MVLSLKNGGSARSNGVSVVSGTYPVKNSLDASRGEHGGCTQRSPCDRCRRDQAFLRSSERPSPRAQRSIITAVDLFAGCGGMTLGLEEAARGVGCDLSVSLAIDIDSAALAIYESNFRARNARCDNVDAAFDGSIGGPLTPSEKKIATETGQVDVLLGGPPCQGHSDLNNYTRRIDPKNALFLRMARAAEVLMPQIVIIENVATVRRDRGNVVKSTSDALKASGYVVDGAVLDLSKIGVPQRRRRFVLIASKLPNLDPAYIFRELTSLTCAHPDRTVRWAIGDLMCKRPEGTFERVGAVSDDNKRRIELLFREKLFDLPNRHRPDCHRDGNHSYKSMYGRLRWGRPAQTITTGFGSMGQGRYVHPQRQRTLTPHEAARLQTFPDWFDFGRNSPRGILGKVIGNAVPPLLMSAIGALVVPAIVAAHSNAIGEIRKRA